MVYSAIHYPPLLPLRRNSSLSAIMTIRNPITASTTFPVSYCSSFNALRLPTCLRFFPSILRLKIVMGLELCQPRPLPPDIFPLRPFLPSLPPPYPVFQCPSPPPATSPCSSSPAIQLHPAFEMSTLPLVFFFFRLHVPFFLQNKQTNKPNRSIRLYSEAKCQADVRTKYEYSLIKKTHF